MRLPDDGFPNDALWRLSSHVIWHHAMVISTNTGLPPTKQVLI